MPLDLNDVHRRTGRSWDADLQAALEAYVEVPAVSVAFDPDWAEHGEIDRAAGLLAAWAAERDIAGLRVEVLRLPGRTPVVLCEVPPFGDGHTGDVLLYGHLDKQPPMEPWRDGLGPWTPVVEGDRLFGRGAADDGYSIFAALTAIEALQAAGGAHGRCLTLIEGSEESGSVDLPAVIEHLGDRLGSPELVVCLDSGAGDYERLWLSTSLRGVVVGTLHVDVLEESVHSGISAGAPDSFRVARALLSRVEDEATGRVTLDALRPPVPPERQRQIDEAATVLGDRLGGDLPLVAGTRPVATGADLLRLRTWEPTLSVAEAGGLPPLGEGSAVLRPSTSLTVEVRLPPTIDPEQAAQTLVDALTSDPPHGARVRYDVRAAVPGWDAPPTSPWLADVLHRASVAAFGRPPASMGIGGTIPFMAMLGRRFPDAQFVVTGVLGPASNADGPNEFLHLPTARSLATVVASVLDAHARR